MSRPEVSVQQFMNGITDAFNQLFVEIAPVIGPEACQRVADAYIEGIRDDS